MVDAKPRKRSLLFCVLTALVLITNFSVYRLEDVPMNMAYGSIIDLMIIIPLMAYFFIIRRHYSVKMLSIVIAAGYGAAWLIIPNEHLSSLPFFKYLIITAEGAFLLFELYIAFKLVKMVPKVFAYTKNLKYETQDFFPHRLEAAIQQNMKAPLAIQIYLTELSLFYYSLFSWKKKSRTGKGTFTLHQKTSTIALYIMLIHAIIIESLGLHYFLHQWNAWVAWILLFLNVYSVLFFIAQIQGFRLNPLKVTAEELTIRMGFASRIIIPLKNIASVTEYVGPEKLPRNIEKITFQAIAPDFVPEPPHLEIKLVTPQKAHYLYGITKEVSQVHLRMDDPAGFKKFILEELADEKGDF
ncbi:hypothetical protein [Bacillus sp. AK031]